MQVGNENKTSFYKADAGVKRFTVKRCTLVIKLAFTSSLNNMGQPGGIDRNMNGNEPFLSHGSRDVAPQTQSRQQRMRTFLLEPTWFSWGNATTLDSDSRVWESSGNCQKRQRVPAHSQDTAD